jgi:methyl halide transferase
MHDQPFWEDRWQSGQTGWNLGTSHIAFQNLLEHCGLEKISSNQALVPGCGHGHDALYFAQNDFRTLGIDFSPTAIDHANQLYKNVKSLDFKVANFFELQNSSADIIADRAMFCALDIVDRPKYIQKIAELLRDSKSCWLLIAFEQVDQELSLQGPPFTLDQNQIKELWSSFGTVEKVWQGRDPNTPEVIINEAAYILRRS